MRLPYMEECISEFEIIKKHPIHPLVFICFCLPVPLSLSPLFLSLTHTYLTHRHTQSGPQMAWWCQGERGLLGSKSSSVWAPPPFTCFLLLFLFPFVIFIPPLPLLSISLPLSLSLSTPPCLSFSCSVSLHFFP